MGLLDMFNDPQQMGLLNAAVQMMAASGPSTTPVSFGQVLAKGLGGYQQGMDTVNQRATQDQLRQMNALKLQDAASDLKNQEALREREAKIQMELRGAGDQPQAAQPSAQVTPPQVQEPQQMASMMPGGPMSPRVAGPDWMQAYQSQTPQQPAQAAQAAPVQQLAAASPQDLQADTAQRLLKEAAIRSKYGDNDGANKLYEAAVKLQPKYSTDFRMAMGADGQPHNYVLADNGTWKDTGLGVKPEMTEVDLNGSKRFVDKNRVKDGQTFIKTISPDAAASNALGWSRLKFDKSQADTNQDAPMDPLAVRMTAQQYLAGDTSALQNFGRGAQGAANLNAVRLEIAKQANAAGMNGADIAARVAEFAGTKAGQRTAGTRSASIEIAANEVNQLAPLALDASSKVARSGFMPFGKAQVMFNSNVNDPNMRQFAMANTALVNAYGQAMARGGSATVSDKDHARELLSTAFDQPSYAAAVEQLQRETAAAQRAPKDVRREISAGVSGSSAGHGSAPVVPAGGKVMTLADIAATAKSSGKTTAEVTKRARDLGYTIGGQ